MYDGDAPFETDVHKSKLRKILLFNVNDCLLTKCSFCAVFFLIFYRFKVCTEGRLVLEFTFDDLMRIKTWHMAVRAHREMIPRNVVGMHTHPSQSDPGMLEQLSKNITRQGITNSTLNYLRVSV
jgi:LIM-domain binding protein